VNAGSRACFVRLWSNQVMASRRHATPHSGRERSRLFARQRASGSMKKPDHSSPGAVREAL
jgi:hypothetical protein